MKDDVTLKKTTARMKMMMVSTDLRVISIR